MYLYNYPQFHIHLYLLTYLFPCFMLYEKPFSLSDCGPTTLGRVLCLRPYNELSLLLYIVSDNVLM